MYLISLGEEDLVKGYDFRGHLCSALCGNAAAAARLRGSRSLIGTRYTPTLSLWAQNPLGEGMANFTGVFYK